MSANMSILIAEDNVAQRRYLRELLEREFPAHGPVIEAADGDEALRLALKERPRLCATREPHSECGRAKRRAWRNTARRAERGTVPRARKPAARCSRGSQRLGIPGGRCPKILRADRRARSHGNRQRSAG